MKQITRKHNRRTQAEWSALIARFEVSGLSQEQFCLQEEVAPSTFWKWRAKLRLSTQTTEGFVELPSITPSTPSEWDRELDLGGGVVFRMRGR